MSEYITREESVELRKLINIANDTLTTWKQRAIEAEALAASRLELLRRQNKTRVEKGMCCLVCGAGVYGFTRTGKFELTDNHTEDCELAKELGDD